MNINKINVGNKVKTINGLVNSYLVIKKLKTRLWLYLEDTGHIFFNVNPSIIKKVVQQ